MHPLFTSSWFNTPLTSSSHLFCINFEHLFNNMFLCNSLAAGVARAALEIGVGRIEAST